ncbi:MAG: DNA-binding response regulator, partial [Rectinema sp.]|nr:DNA-binding response regulator [Rectinema sp.]
ALRYGVIDYLLKPASTTEMEGAIRRAVERLRRRKEEEKRRDTAATMALDIEHMSIKAIGEALERGTLDMDAMDRVSMLKCGATLWSCLVLAASPEHASHDYQQEIQSPRLPSLRRFIAGLAKSYLATDLGLASDVPVLLWDALLNDHVFLLLLYPGLPRLDSSNLSLQAGVFLSRCVERGAGAILLGISVGNRGTAGQLISRAKLAVTLAHRARRVIVLDAADIKLESGRARRSDVSSRAASWLQTHFMEHIGLDDMASALNLSPSHLSRLLRAAFGMGFSEMLARIRIANAKSLIAEGLSVKEAAFLVGYHDQSYFTKAFLRMEGMLPSGYADAKRT